MARAFPSGINPENQNEKYEPGLSRREFYAGLMLPVLAYQPPKEAAANAVQYAEALIDRLDNK